jgi:hypothetical protein
MSDDYFYDYKKRPQTRGGGAVTTPHSASMITLLGSGIVSHGLALSRDENRALNKLYGLVPEKPHQRPPKPVFEPDPDLDYFERQRAETKFKEAVKAWELWEDPRHIMQAGADRNMIRHAQADGLRLMAWFAKFVPAGEDPLKHLIQVVSNGGCDVEPEDIDWAMGENSGMAEEPEESVPPEAPKKKRGAKAA